jgi:hypothetical protein
MLSDWFAISEIDGAINRTKDLLWPFNLDIWLRLAVISFFVGGTGGGGGSGFQSTGNDLPSNIGSVPIYFGDAAISNIMLLILLAVGIIFTLIVLYVVIGSIMQFVFVDCLSSNRVSLSRTFSMRGWKGIRLLLFQLALIIVFILVMVAFALLFLAPLLLGINSFDFLGIISLIILVPVIIIIAIIFGVAQMLTIDFVVPAMIHDDCGVIDGWKTVFAFLKGRSSQVIVYILMKFLLGIATVIVMAVLVVIAIFLLAIPFAVLAAIIAFLITGFNAILLVLLIPFIVIAIPLILLLSVPFITFHRYYSLLVLGRFSPDYLLLSKLPEKGAAEIP